ncbi:MAG TPA: MHYT domain-containing protein [Streptosporangiaceae bacterium]
MIHVNEFSNGALNPALAYIVSCAGCFLGLRCTTRARAYQGAARARWLVIGALAIATTGIWVMHFIGMLGFTIPGQAIRYNVLITIASMVLAVLVVGIGLFIVGFSRRAGNGPLLTGGLILGIGVASMHYVGMMAIRVPDSLSYNPGLVAASVIIAVAAGVAALWAALRLDSLFSTFVASLIMGVAVSGMHYTGMAALHVTADPSRAVSTAASASAGGFLLPLIIGLGSLGFIFSAVIALSPTAAEIVEENALMERIGRSQAARHASQGQSAQGRAAPAGQQAWRGQGYANGNGYPNGQGYSNGQPNGHGQPNGNGQPGEEEPGSLFRPRRPSAPGDQPLFRQVPSTASSAPDVIGEPGAKRPGRSEERTDVVPGLGTFQPGAGGPLPPGGYPLVAEQRDARVVGRVAARGGLEHAVPVHGDAGLLQRGGDLLEFGAEPVAGHRGAVAA